MRSRRATRSRTSRTCWRASSRASTRTSTRRTSSRTTISASRSRRWGCSTKPSPNCRRRCGRPKENSERRRCSASASEKGAYGVAESILRRGLDLPASGDQERLGILYWLGRALEHQGKKADARDLYGRVFAVDIRFLDAEQRVKALAKAK